MSPPLAIAWHNGALCPLAEVAISPLDRGFLFGDGVYEVIPAYAGKVMGLGLHLSRLRRSLAAIDLPAPYSEAQWQALIEQLIAANGGGSQAIYLQVSRAGDVGRDHKFPATQVANVFAMCSALVEPKAADYAEGLSAITLADERWARCDIKSTSLLANVLAKQAASKAGAIEAILLHDDFLVEGAASAIACVIDGVLVAPPETNHVLPSITRELVWKLAKLEGIDTRIERISSKNMFAADEVLMMSSTKEIVPIVKIDAQPIGSGKPGEIWQRLFNAYQAAKTASET